MNVFVCKFGNMMFLFIRNSCCFCSTAVVLFKPTTVLRSCSSFVHPRNSCSITHNLCLFKDCVSKKRKLKETNEKKETLLDEIRFLKRRRNLLLKLKSQKLQPQQDTIQLQKAPLQHEVGQGGSRASTSEPQLQTPLLAVGSIWNSASLPREEVGFPSVKFGKKSKDLFSNGKRVEKRKIYWQDQLALKV